MTGVQCNIGEASRELCREPPSSRIRIDDSRSKDHVSLVKLRFSLLLLLGALLGLLAQEAAFASAPAMPMSKTAVASTAMSEECAEMMGVDTSQPDQPCKGMTLDCIAKMGCAMPLAVVTPAAPLAVSDYRRELADPLAVQRLVGRSFGPEPEPPLFLG